MNQYDVLVGETL